MWRGTTGRALLEGGRSLLGSSAAALLVVAACSAALDLPVAQDGSVDTVFAERFQLAQSFEVVATAVGQAVADAPALGTPDTPMELTEAPAPANTALHQGDRTFTATVVERAADAVTGGNYTVEATLDEASLGLVSITQGVSDPLLREGARVTFDLGSRALDTPLFVVYVRPVVPAGWSYTLKVVACPDSPLDFCWEGVGGAIDGQVNPTLDGRAGQAIDVTIVCDASATATHDLRVKDSGGQTVAGPTPDLDCPGGASQELQWVPSDAATYRYECKYHLGTQHGNMTITT